MVQKFQMKTSFIIRPPKSFKEIKEGQQLLANLFKKVYNTFPEEIPDQVLYAFSVPENKIVASIGLEIKKSGKDLEVERYFDFSMSKIYPKINIKEFGEIERLSSLNRFITPYLIYAILKFALNININYISTFNKKIIAEVFTRMYKLEFLDFEPIILQKTLDGVYRDYFNKSDLIIFTQKTEILYNLINKNFKFNSNIVKFQIPNKIQMPKKLVKWN